MTWDGEERRRNPLCKVHSQELKDIWISIRGNGHPEDGLVYKVKVIADFVDVIKRIIWVVVPICLAGAFSAIGLFIIASLKLLSRHGLL